MKKVISISVLQLSSFASIFGVYISIYPFSVEGPLWHWLLICFSFLITIYLMINEIRDHLRNTPKTFKTDAQINAYMRRWVSSGGRTVIFSRDMSWAHEKETKQILIEKAERKELTLFVESNPPIIDDLERMGAKVIHYKGIHIPRSRFTIVDYEKEGARVAVGAKQNGVHIIQEYRNGEHPFFGVAEDLVKFLKSVENRK